MGKNGLKLLNEVAMASMVFRINHEVFDMVAKAKGWNKVTDLARATGYNKSYISLVFNKHVGISADFMIALIKAVGFDWRNAKEWSRLFIIEPGHRYSTKWMKYYGRTPYDKLSDIGPWREKDREAGALPFK